MKTLLIGCLLVSGVAFAANPVGKAQPQAPAQWNGGGERGEEMQRRMRMMLVVGLADALSLNEGEAIALADKIKVFDEQRAPVRESMKEAMKTLKSAADGDQAALGQVDNATQKIFDGRQQMAAIDKQMFQTISKDMQPQKRAQLAMFLAKFHAKGMGMGGHHGDHEGRKHLER
ncbi:MAG: hypothetical protein QM723_25915 [Myxococcaceae bacterium]